MTADRVQRLRPGRSSGPGLAAAALVAAATVSALGAPRAVGAQADPPEFARPRHVRGIYLNAWTAGSASRLAALLDLAARTEINTFMVDVKDASGYMTYASSVPLAKEIGAKGDVRAREALRDLGVPVTAPVLGLTVAAQDDLGIGQRWERFIIRRAGRIMPANQAVTGTPDRQEPTGK